MNTTVLACTVVITDSDQVVTTDDPARVINVDRPATLESELSSALPNDPATAQTTIQQLLTSDFAARITKAHQDVVDAWSMGVTKIPAVVVDKKFVVYGETDVQRALDRIEAYRVANP
jgi:integrating conjugative element protein (TIGR03757 family)